MKILIYGAGAVGRYLAVKLAMSGGDISLIDRVDYSSIIKNDGLSLKTQKGFFNVKEVKFFAGLDEIKKLDISFDYVFFAVKSFDLDSALLSALPVLKDSKILVFQNGIGNEELAFKFYPKDKIISATLTSAVSIDDKGAVVTAEKGGIGLSGIKSLPPEDLIDAFKSSNFVIDVYHSYREMKWSKLILNIIGNATSAILGLEPGVILKDRRVFAIEIFAVREILDLMRREKLKVVNLPGFPVRKLAFAVNLLPAFVLQKLLAKKFSEGRGGKFPSLYLDLAKNKKDSEIDWFNGAVLNYDGAFPANRTLTGILKEMVKGAIQRSQFYSKPDKLWQEFKKIQKKV